jgi:hypothetical protein
MRKKAMRFVREEGKEEDISRRRKIRRVVAKRKK